MAKRFQYRRDPAANWTTTNPILGDGEPGYESDTGFMKIGDGLLAWNALAYFSAGASTGDGITIDKAIECALIYG